MNHDIMNRTITSHSMNIAGTGHYLPKTSLSIDTVEAQHNAPKGSLAALFPNGTRHYVDGESQIDMGLAAAQMALDDAGITADQVDLVISASGIPYQTLPATAPLYMQRLGIKDGHAAAFDVNSTCLSFVSGLDLAAAQIATGQAKTALIIASEIASRALPWSTAPDVAALFADGAGAMIVSAGNSRLSPVLFETYPSAYDACQIGAGGTRIDIHKNLDGFVKEAVFQMDGATLFRLTARHFPAFIHRLLDRAGWGKNDVDLFIPHQASPHAIEHIARIMDVNLDRVMDLTASHGNQIAASIPIAIDAARRDGRLEKGQKILILGTSAGVSFAGCALEV